jgi:general secretion pathway protein D
LNRMVISGIKALMLSFGLAASLRAAEPAPGDDVSAGHLTLLSPLPNPEAAAGGQDVPSPPVPATGGDSASGAGQVPSAVPLPNSTAPAAAQGSPPAAPMPAQRSTSPAQEPTRPPEKPAPTRPTGDVRSPEIQFDSAGLISMHTNELDVRQLLELISRRSGMNILVSPKVSGTITANFEKVTIQELLGSILKLADLVEKVEGGIHFIYSKGELKDVAETALKERIVTKVYRLNYIRADELMVMISPFLSSDVGRKRFATSANYQFGISESSTLTTGGVGAAGGGVAGGGAGGAVAPGGAGTIQRGTQPITGGASMASNDLVVIQDYESNLKIIDQLIRRLDVQPVQVLIEAVIISVELALDTQLGVNFAVVDNLGQQLGTIGAGAVINSNVGFTPASVLTAAGKIASSTIPDPNGFASSTNGIKYGFISNNITGFVRALETVGSTKILASPRILVLNKQRAEIQLGARLGFRSSVTQNIIGTTQQVQFLNTGTLLRLRPFVSSDDIIRMEIHPERSEGVVDPTTGLPSQTVAELTTNVMVPNGATLVIGGLIGDEDDYTQSGLPGLSRLPILGSLFGTKEKTDTRQELVVLLTPHIWSPGQVGGNPDHLATQGSKGSGGDVRQAPAATTAALAPNSRAAIPAPSPAAAAAAAKPSPGLAPATLPPLPPLSSRSALPPVETIEVSRRTGLSGTLESQPEPLAADRLASSKSLADPQPVSRPQPAQVAKVDSMVSQTSMDASRVSQSVRPAVPEAARPVSRRHVVRPGEDFSSIARYYYGSPRLARALWWVNRKTVAWPGALVAGTRIVIPPIEQIEGKSAGPRSNRAATATLDPQVQPASQNRPAEGVRGGRAATHVVPTPDQERPATDASSPEGGFAIHVVQPHETLRGIARDRLGDPRRFQEIAELNRDLLTDGRLSPGMRLLLPHDARPALLRRD